MLDDKSRDDIEQICRLKALFLRYVDTKNWGGLRNEVFTPDATLDAIEGVDPTRGIDNIIALLIEVVGNAMTVHHGHMPEIDITGPDTAKGIWAMEDLVRWPPDALFQGKFSKLQGAGHYYETYVRGPSGWRIHTVKETDRLFLDYT